MLAYHLHEMILPSPQQNRIGTSEFDLFRSSIPSPWSPRAERYWAYTPIMRLSNSVTLSAFVHNPARPGSVKLSSSTS